MSDVINTKAEAREERFKLLGEPNLAAQYSATAILIFT